MKKFLFLPLLLIVPCVYAQETQFFSDILSSLFIFILLSAVSYTGLCITCYHKAPKSKKIESFLASFFFFPCFWVCLLRGLFKIIFELDDSFYSFKVGIMIGVLPFALAYFIFWTMKKMHSFDCL